MIGTKTRRSLLAFSALLVLVGSIGWGAVSLGRFLIQTLRVVENEVLAALVAASGTVLAAVATVAYSQSRTKKREVEEAHRPEKARIYGSFMKLMVDQLIQVKSGSAQAGGKPDPKTVQVMADFKRDLIVWGSPRVIQAYLRFESKLDAKNARLVILLADAVLSEMRRDLGNSNWGLSAGTLWSLFLTNEARVELGLSR